MLDYERFSPIRKASSMSGLPGEMRGSAYNSRGIISLALSVVTLGLPLPKPRPTARLHRPQYCVMLRLCVRASVHLRRVQKLQRKTLNVVTFIELLYPDDMQRLSRSENRNRCHASRLHQRKPERQRSYNKTYWRRGA